MKIKYHLLLSVLLLLIAIGTFGQSDGIVQGVIRIKLRPDLVPANQGVAAQRLKGKLITGIKTLDAISATYSVTDMQRVFKYSPKYEERHRKHGLHLWYEIKYSAKISSSEVVKAYKSTAGVLLAEPLFKAVLFDGKYTPANITKSWSKSIAGSMPFNDPGLPDQWHYNNTGQYGGTVGKDINLFNAWTLTAGKPNVVVAVTDQGVDYTHEDLVDNMWTNEAELNGKLGVDDDGNGYIDDIHGFNFTTNYGDVDKGQHGTHVAGTIAAMNNNGVGVSGVAGGTGHGDGARIMSCEILGASSGSIEDSYIYSADNGAVISQNSWGYNGGGSPEDNHSLYAAIDYFIAEAGNFPNSPMKGGVVIFASGNNGTNELAWPAAYSKVISVAALGARGEATEYTNFGKWVNIAAPGGSSNVNPRQGVLSSVPGNKYAYMDGTSMACPHVSGVAALIVAKFGGADFKNSFLTNHLLTGIRKEIYDNELNKNFIDSLGVGALDASLALAADNKIAPNAIIDFKLDGISNDFVNVSWSVPTDNDDGKPWYFRLLYSTNNQFADAKIIDLINKSEIGQTISAEIADLAGSTTYYFAVQSLDRWGNISENSNVVSGLTNEGPITVINPETLAPIEINVAANPLGSGIFTISNTGAGILKYSISKFHQSNEDKYSNSAIKYPKIKTFGFQKSIVGSLSLPSHETITPLNQKPINPENRKEYTSLYQGGYIVGETDTTFNNSAALRFAVNDSAGFNLTNIEALLKLDRSKGPAVIEIYSGKEISTAKLLYAQNYLVSTWSSNSAQIHSIKLDDQIYLPKGTYFWIVIHAPHGQLYPLGANREMEKGQSANCYYSKSLGKSWEKLVDVFWDNQLVWSFSAISKLEPLGKYITLSSEKGVLNSTESADITINVDASKLINGTYNEDLIIYTNQANQALIHVPYSITVDNQKPELIVPEILDFGSVVVGLEKTIDVVLPNIGLGKLKDITVSYSNNEPEQFSTKNWLSDISATDKGLLQIQYKPTVASTLNSVVTITGNDQTMPEANSVSYTFVINAVAINPPIITIDPVSASYPDLASGAVVSGAVKITNTGVYPLKYYVPGKAKSNVANESKYVHKYGYYFANNPSAYVWDDIAASGTNVTKKVASSNKRNSMYQVPLNFDFPFFGVKEDSIYVSRFGVLAFTKDAAFNRSPLGFKDGDDGWGSSNPSRFISALGNLDVNLTAGGQIYYQQFADKFVVQYSNIKYFTFPGEMTFQMVLYENGDIRFYYKTVEWESWILEGSTLIDIEDLILDDALAIHDNYWSSPYYSTNIPASGDVFDIKNPGMGIITSIDKPNGVVAAGSSVTINYTINTSILPEGNSIEKINFVSNDPVNPVLSHNIDLSIISGGTSKVKISGDALAFGDIPITGSKKMQVSMQNTGTKNVKITEAKLDNTNYSLVESNTDLNCGRTLPFVIAINTSILGSKPAVLTITTDEPKTYTVQITGNVIEKAGITADITAIEKNLVSGQSEQMQVIVTNTGNNTLEYYPVGNQWIKVDQSSTISSTSTDADYSLTTSTDATNNCAYSWEDITSTGTKISSLERFWEDEELYWSTVKLPWTFDFYGNKYDSISMGATGILSFAKEAGRNFYMGPQNGIPDPNIPNNFIAPIYSFGGIANKIDYPKAGYYYQVFDDRIVFEFAEFFNNFGMGEPMSCQAILYKDGHIKFQYQSVNFINITYGLVGIENKDGSKGFEISNRKEGIVNPAMAFLFSPIKKHTLSAGASETLNVKIDAQNIFAGEYSGKLSLDNNTPDFAAFNIPATLTVTGSPIAQVSTQNADFGEVFAYRYFDTDWYQEMWKSYSKTISIKNSGTANMVINSLSLGNDISPVLVAGVSVYDPMWGTTFTNISDLSYPITITPNDSLTLSVYLFHPNFSYALEAPFANINTDLTVNIEGVDPQIIPVKAIIKTPPMIEVDKTDIAYSTNLTDFTVSDAVKVTNTQAAGGGDLKYSVSFQYKRNLAKASAASTQTSSFIQVNSAKPISQIYAGSRFAKKGDANYNRTLEYSTETVPSNKIGYGGDFQFGAATAFTAPADGFNLSHVATWYAPGNASNSRIYIEIRGGTTNPNDAELIYSQAYDFTSPQEDKEGKMHTIKLDKNVTFYPNETFYVIFYYPLQAEYPQGIVDVSTSTTDRYYYLGYQNDAVTTYWADLTSIPQYAKTGYMAKAFEETYQSTAWVVLDPNTPNTGTIAPENGNNSLGLLFNAKYAVVGNNTAKMIISSNDPALPSKTVNLSLYLNQAPKFKDGSVLNLSVDENAILNYSAKVSDPEGNTITTIVDQMPGLTSSIANNVVSLTFAPTYDDAGIHTFNIKATDEFGAVSNLTVNITVNAVNRAPIAKVVADKMLYTTNLPLKLKASDIFTDPDGDALSYSATSDNGGLIEIAISTDGFIVTPKLVGNVNITLTAVDTHNAAINTTFALTIKENQSPVAKVVDAQTIALRSGNNIFDLTTVFIDAEADALTFALVSVSTANASAFVTGSTLTMQAVAVGTSKITVSATDKLSNPVNVEITVNVVDLNHIPAAKTVAAKTIALRSGNNTFDLATAFADADATDVLSYSLISVSTANLTASVLGSTLTMQAVSVGTSKITVSATDKLSNPVNVEITVNVVDLNHIPTAKTVAAQTIALRSGNNQFDLMAAFADADATDVLSFSLINVSTANVLAYISGSKLNMAAISVGTAKITVSATDKLSNPVNVEITVNVVDLNHQPVATGTIANQKVAINGNFTEVDFSNVFTDADHDALTYNVSSSSPSILEVSATGTYVVLMPKTAGNVTVTVLATDNMSAAVSKTFMVEVANLENEAVKANVTLSPNGDGVNDNWKIDHAELYKDCEISIFNANGQILFTSAGYNAEWDGTYNGKELPTGTYYYTVKFPNGNVKTGTIALIK